MQRIPLRLQLLNILRWIKIYFLPWLILLIAYSLALLMFIQPMGERFYSIGFVNVFVWASVGVLIFLPGLLENLKLPGLSSKIHFPFLNPVAQIYCQHVLRRMTAWLGVFIVFFLSLKLEEGRWPLWILLCQIPVQQALFSVYRWRFTVLNFYPERGAKNFVLAFMALQTVLYFCLWSLVSLTHPDLAFKIGPVGLATIWGASAMVFEGDSGRPWLVNWISAVAGLIAGFCMLFSWWAIFGVVYFCQRMWVLSERRLKSVEVFSEDTLIP